MTVCRVEMRVEGHIGVVSYDNAPTNAVDRQGYREIRETFWSIAKNSEIHVVVLTAAGDRIFMGGKDLREVDDKAALDREEFHERIDEHRLVREAIFAVYDCPVPVIAAVNGAAIGAGVAFVSVSDFIIAAENARFSAPAINVGLMGGGAFLSLLVGRQRMREMYFTGDPISAEELHELGVVRAVVPQESLHGSALDFAAKLAMKSPIALRYGKESLNRIENLSIKDAYQLEQSYTARLKSFDDSKEARVAFFEKREPIWRLL